jgi:hypothetical protein
MKYLLTKSDHYKKFLIDNKNDRLSKNLKIYSSSKDKLVGKIFNQNLNEIFDKELKTEYEIKPNTKFEIEFLTSSKNKYRLDIIPKIENRRL